MSGGSSAMETESSPSSPAGCASRASAALLCQELLVRRLYRCLDAQTRQRLPLASASFGRLYHPRRFVRSLNLASRLSAKATKEDLDDEEVLDFLTSFPKLRRLSLPVSLQSAPLAAQLLAAYGGQLRSVTLLSSGVPVTGDLVKDLQATRKAFRPVGLWEAYAGLLKALPRGLVALHLHWRQGHQPQVEWPEEVLGEAVAFLRQAGGLRLLCLQDPALLLGRVPADLLAPLRALRTRNCCFDHDNRFFFHKNGEELPRLGPTLLRLSTAASLSKSPVLPQSLTTVHLRVTMDDSYDATLSFLPQLDHLRHLALSVYEEYGTPIGGRGPWTLEKADVLLSLSLHSLSVRVVNSGCMERRIRLPAPGTLRQLRIASTSSRYAVEELHTAPLLLARRTVFPRLTLLQIDGCRMLRTPRFGWQQQFPALERLELVEAAHPLDLETSPSRDLRPRPDLCLTQPHLFQHLAQWEKDLAI